MKKDIILDIISAVDERNDIEKRLHNINVGKLFLDGADDGPFIDEQMAGLITNEDDSLNATVTIGSEELEDKLEDKETEVKLESLITESIKKIEKEEKKFIDNFYQAIKSLYSHMKYAISYLTELFDEYSVIARNLADKAFNDYYNFVILQTRGFVYKKRKGGDKLLDVVAYNEVTGIDYDEKMELMRADKFNIRGNNNYTDPEARERWKIWTWFSFNQIMSFFYYDNAI